MPHRILKKTIQVGSSTILSRILGIFREYFSIKYFGVGALSDAFVTAFSIPNMMRSIFAEGALSAAFIPLFITTLRTKDKKHAYSLMTLSFLVFEGVLLLLVVAIAIWPENVVRAISWGFSDEQVALSAPLLQLLIFFVVFISSSALLAAALQAVGHFFVPSFGQVLINIVMITGLVTCIYAGLSATYLCLFILLAGFFHFLMHLIAYWRAGLRFAPITRESWQGFGQLFFAFFTCALSSSVAEIDYFVDRGFASYLPQGSISLLFYANRFMAIPLGVFAVAFSTILMPHFSRISMYAPRRFSFYLLESAKIVLWVMLPVTILICFFSEKIFITLFLSSQFSYTQAHQAGLILVAFTVGLFFFSLNKIILNMYYALRATLLPLFISIVAVCTNAGLNSVFINWYGTAGLALATSVSGMVQTVCLLLVLRYYFRFELYVKPFLFFVIKYCIQLAFFFMLFFGLYYAASRGIDYCCNSYWQEFLLNRIGFWLWVGPLSLLLFGVLLKLRKHFQVRLHFLPESW